MFCSAGSCAPESDRARSRIIVRSLAGANNQRRDSGGKAPSTGTGGEAEGGEADGR